MPTLKYSAADLQKRVRLNKFLEELKQNQWIYRADKEEGHSTQLYNDAQRNLKFWVWNSQAESYETLDVTVKQKVGDENQFYKQFQDESFNTNINKQIEQLKLVYTQNFGGSDIIFTLNNSLENFINSLNAKAISLVVQQQKSSKDSSVYIGGDELFIETIQENPQLFNPETETIYAIFKGEVKFHYKLNHQGQLELTSIEASTPTLAAVCLYETIPLDLVKKCHFETLIEQNLEQIKVPEIKQQLQQLTHELVTALDPYIEAAVRAVKEDIILQNKFEFELLQSISLLLITDQPNIGLYADAICKVSHLGLTLQQTIKKFEQNAEFFQAAEALHQQLLNTLTRKIIRAMSQGEIPDISSSYEFRRLEDMQAMLAYLESTKPMAQKEINLEATAPIIPTVSTPSPQEAEPLVTRQEEPKQQEPSSPSAKKLITPDQFEQRARKDEAAWKRFGRLVVELTATAAKLVITAGLVATAVFAASAPANIYNPLAVTQLEDSPCAASETLLAEVDKTWQQPVIGAFYQRTLSEQEQCFIQNAKLASSPRKVPLIPEA